MLPATRIECHKEIYQAFVAVKLLIYQRALVKAQGACLCACEDLVTAFMSAVFVSGVADEHERMISEWKGRN